VWFPARAEPTLESTIETDQENGMRTILIAHRDADFAEHLTTELHAWGFRVINCPGPLPPALRCIRCDKGYCPLTEGADLMIYDPDLVAVDDAGREHNLALDSAIAHPDVPMLLASSVSEAPAPEAVRLIVTAAPWVRVAAHEPAAFRRQLSALLSPVPVIP
jgi:hypothetical protein